MTEPAHGAAPSTNGQPTHPEVRFEKTDANFRPILLVLIATAAFGVAAHVGVMYFLTTYGDYQERVKRSTFPLAQEPSNALPAEPRLEHVERLAGVMKQSVYKRQAAQLEQVDTYGPTDEEGFIRVPVDDAMRYLAGKLPARPELSADQRRKAGGLVDGGEPNSGRMFRSRGPR